MLFDCYESLAKSRHAQQNYQLAAEQYVKCKDILELDMPTVNVDKLEHVYQQLVALYKTIAQWKRVATTMVKLYDIQCAKYGPGAKATLRGALNLCEAFIEIGYFMQATKQLFSVLNLVQNRLLDAFDDSKKNSSTANPTDTITAGRTMTREKENMSMFDDDPITSKELQLLSSRSFLMLGKCFLQRGKFEQAQKSVDRVLHLIKISSLNEDLVGLSTECHLLRGDICVVLGNAT